MRLIALGVCVFLFTACSSRQVIEAPVGTPAYHIHTVTYSGETLGLISSWYTGKAAHWKKIVEHNHDVNVRNLQIGQEIRIPEELMTRSTALPKKFLPQQPTFVAASQPSERPATSAEVRMIRPQQPMVRKQNVNWNVVGDYLYPDER